MGTNLQESRSVPGKHGAENVDVLGASGKRKRGTTPRGLATFNAKPVEQRAKEPVVYFVQAESGVIKIGTTGGMEWRMKTLRGQSPLPLTLLATVHGGRAEEHAYHRRFAADRLHGEWFTRSPEIEAEIARLQGVRA